MTTNLPFSPVGASTQLTASSTGGTLTIAAIDTVMAPVLRTVVNGTGAIAISIGGAASTTGMMMLGNTIETFARGDAATVGVIAITGTPTVSVQGGQGGP